jgi:hypothetical protein
MQMDDRNPDALGSAELLDHGVALLAPSGIHTVVGYSGRFYAVRLTGVVIVADADVVGIMKTGLFELAGPRHRFTLH